MKLMLGTSNPGKIKEFQSLLEELDIELYIPVDESIALDIKEDGETYKENALIKAKAFAETADMWALADDSGLEVDALQGAPGLRSARFAPSPGATDADRRRHLLEQLKDEPAPWTARFRCVVAVAHPDGIHFTSEGTCPGQIIPQERGKNGFGYDPIFLVMAKGRTMAELHLEEKNKVSHRAKAVQHLIPHLRDLIAAERR
ncbi:MAG: RdgB/HAM1 family non-canonical purine NTP pyrophosphatase [Anaerolineales bacterium]